EKSILHYYVDEAGDPVLFNRKGKILVGKEGCSDYFILGKLDIENPEILERELTQLRLDLLADPYFKRVPSMQPERMKTAIGFHAKDDVPEVRREVYKLLMNHPVQFYAVVRNKSDLLSYVHQQNERDKSYRYSQNEQYDILVKELFRNFHRLSDETNICFAKRGTKTRNYALNKALEQAETAFEKDFGFRRKTKHVITSSTPPQSTGLQAVDYYLWALQRFYERKEERYIELIWDQVAEIHDLGVIAKGKKGTYFTKQKPLNLAAFDEN
ncbi:MAG TPA: DUF3800 domain-containing protein, partial [Leucothrix sp.]|nr:DUF3800 domain-containing protein [Leucothrix sp.]